MYVSLHRLLVLVAAVVALFAASAVSQDVGTAIWSAGYGDDARTYSIAVDPATGESYAAIVFYGESTSRRLVFSLDPRSLTLCNAPHFHTRDVPSSRAHHCRWYIE